MPQPRQSAQHFRAIAAQAWIGMLVMPVADCATDLWRLAIHGAELNPRPNDPLLGIWFFTLATGASALLTVALRTFDSRSFRRFVFFASALYLAALILIQSIDIALHLPWTGFHVIFVSTHDILALWACWASYHWLRLAPAGEFVQPQTNSGASGGDA